MKQQLETALVLLDQARTILSDYLDDNDTLEEIDLHLKEATFLLVDEINSQTHQRNDHDSLSCET